MESNTVGASGKASAVLPKAGLLRQTARVSAAWIIAGLVLAGCSRHAEPEAKMDLKKHYPLTGEVVSVDVPRNVLVVRHDDIPGFMPAMTMEFNVSPADAAAAKPGQRIRAQLVPAEKGDWNLTQIWPADTSAAGTVDSQANALRQDTLTRGKGVYREIGEKIPEFALYDQNGAVVQSARFAGKQIMLNFIFTRCPVANMCPASTMKMISVFMATS